MLGCAKSRPLEAAHLGSRHGCAQAGIFAGALDDAAPAGIPGDVEHRAKGPVQTGRTRLLGCHRLGPFDERRIPGRCHGQRHGEDRAIAVDDVQGKQQRDPGRAFFHGDFLQNVELFRVVEPQNRTGPALADDLLGI